MKRLEVNVRGVAHSDGAYSMMSSMVRPMSRFTLSVSSSAIPCSPTLKEASLVLPSYLKNTFQRSGIHTGGALMTAATGPRAVHAPHHGGEVRADPGLDESLVERRVWP